MDGGAQHKVIDEVIERLLPLRDKMVGKELLNLSSLFASLAFKAPEDKEWCKRRFAMSMDIFKGTPQHEYYVELVRDEVEPQVRKEGREKGREEERLALLRALRKSLLTIAQARFPDSTIVAKTQARLIKDVTIMNEVISKVGVAQTPQEATNALVSWLPSDDPEEE